SMWLACILKQKARAFALQKLVYLAAERHHTPEFRHLLLVWPRLVFAGLLVRPGVFRRLLTWLDLAVAALTATAPLTGILPHLVEHIIRIARRTVKNNGVLQLAFVLGQVVLRTGIDDDDVTLDFPLRSRAPASCRQEQSPARVGLDDPG